MYMVLAAAALGFVAESLLLANGLMRYSAPWPTDVLAPAWMVALWAAFGTTIETTRRLLGARPLSKSALLGAVFGPLAYLAGERLGALVFPGGAWPSVLAVAVIWALALPALVALQARRRVDGPPFGI